MAKFNINTIGIVMILSLTLITIVSSMLSQYTDMIPLKSGGSFILLFITVMLIYIFVAVSDRKIDRSEIITMFMIAVILVVSGIALNKFMPTIFSAFPTPTKEFFSAFIS